jgi:DNA-binding GntR family transcriptional regulator
VISADVHTRHKSMTDIAADMLRRLIVSRELAPGQRIRQAELASMLGVSTMPIREALLRLVAEGMVIAESNRAFSVTSTTEDGIRDIYWMHATLAGELTARAWDNKTDALVDELSRYNKDYKAAATRNDFDALSNANWQFHAALNRAAASPAIVLQLRNTLHYFPVFGSEVVGWTELAGRWQAGILKEFKSGTREKARQVAVSNITRAGELFILSFWAPADSKAATAAAKQRARANSKPK